MVGWHLRLDGHEFGQAPGVGDGQGSLACCSPWGRKESDTTGQLNNRRVRFIKTEIGWRFPRAGRGETGTFSWGRGGAKEVEGGETAPCNVSILSGRWKQRGADFASCVLDHSEAFQKEGATWIPAMMEKKQNSFLCFKWERRGRRGGAGEKRKKETEPSKDYHHFNKWKGGCFTNKSQQWFTPGGWNEEEQPGSAYPQSWHGVYLWRRGGGGGFSWGALVPLLPGN